ncbi:hypothetical protein TraAM80_07348 [Trypanosoma rangeli]|uniref:Uncharacterized protein n=1 Tax=Trypanosoma rangeli TaxID=5698 RepID=A0A422N646_TRYRA|nr:uncharacterized protein TraAM80_07348 [Trypanosoma rangeli]RNF00948.1 hypothetical protein TraAM80_07348 [Trypanosoma rangeli]|eukprot:RNF00948.1 hypothetical protein TraAM80_07348 [Trypanosoma rangeli]
MGEKQREGWEKAQAAFAFSTLFSALPLATLWGFALAPKTGMLLKFSGRLPSARDTVDVAYGRPALAHVLKLESNPLRHVSAPGATCVCTCEERKTAERR